MDDKNNLSRSRRDVLKAGALTAASAASAAHRGSRKPRTPVGPRSIDWRVGRRCEPPHPVEGRDHPLDGHRVGDFARGDILIEGKKIAAVGADLGAPSANGNAIVIEAADRVIIPGMVDCHRHAWEGQLRGIIPNSANIGDYMGATHRGFAPFYQPEDMYVGNLATALGCLDAGITCVIDNSHNSRSQAHSDAAIQAWFDSGMRAVHASGAATFGEWDKRWPQDSERLMKQFFASDDQLVTFRLFSRGLTKEDWEAARRLGVWLSVDGAGVPNNAQTLQEFQKAGLVDEKHTINHGYGLTDESWKLIRDAGMPVNACPRSDSQWALGNAHMGLQGALNAGIRPGLSVDNDTAYSTDCSPRCTWRSISSAGPRTWRARRTNRTRRRCCRFATCWSSPPSAARKTPRSLPRSAA